MKRNSIPRVAVRSVGAGLFLMAFFTMMWSGIAESGFKGSDHYLVTIFFSAFSLAFIAYGIYLFRISKHFPKLLTDEEKSRGKHIGKWYGIIFGQEGITIPAVCLILLALHRSDFIIPSIALIVGLHFYPMARLFSRKIDYYLATYTCIIGMTGIVLKLQHVPSGTVFSFTGVGVALATTAYGVYMLVEGIGYGRAGA